MSSPAPIPLHYFVLFQKNMSIKTQTQLRKDRGQATEEKLQTASIPSMRACLRFVGTTLAHDLVATHEQITSAYTEEGFCSH